MKTLKSHSGAMMARAFQAMLVQFGLKEKVRAVIHFIKDAYSLTHKILTVNADNAASNDTQTTKLASMDNSFKEENRVRCFNHTLQLSAKTLLRPFNVAIATGDAKDPDIDSDDDPDDMPSLVEHDDDDNYDDDNDNNDNDSDADDNIDKLAVLDDNECERLLASTAAIRETVSKVLYVNSEYECLWYTNDLSFRFDNCLLP
jgi:hypothetical protein